jgi:hypothetical protein
VSVSLILLIEGRASEADVCDAVCPQICRGIQDGDGVRRRSWSVKGARASRLQGRWKQKVQRLKDCSIISEHAV